MKIYIGQSRSGQGRRTEAGGEEERWLVKRYVAGGHYFSLFSLSLSRQINRLLSIIAHANSKSPSLYILLLFFLLFLFCIKFRVFC